MSRVPSIPCGRTPSRIRVWTPFLPSRNDDGTLSRSREIVSFRERVCISFPSVEASKPNPWSGCIADRGTLNLARTGAVSGLQWKPWLYATRLFRFRYGCLSKVEFSSNRREELKSWWDGSFGMVDIQGVHSNLYPSIGYVRFSLSFARSLDFFFRTVFTVAQPLQFSRCCCKSSTAISSVRSRRGSDYKLLSH